MAKQIKFRAWSGESMLDWDNLKSLRYAIENENIHVMQFIELNVESKEVYEDDIIELRKNGVPYFRGVVTSHGYAGYSIDADNDYMDFMLKGYTYHHIGNKFENPELVTTPSEAVSKVRE